MFVANNPALFHFWLIIKKCQNICGHDCRFNISVLIGDFEFWDQIAQRYYLQCKT